MAAITSHLHVLLLARVAPSRLSSFHPASLFSEDDFPGGTG
jgi:hypothetical protein